MRHSSPTQFDQSPNKNRAAREAVFFMPKRNSTQRPASFPMPPISTWLIELHHKDCKCGECPAQLQPDYDPDDCGWWPPEDQEPLEEPAWVAEHWQQHCALEPDCCATPAQEPEQAPDAPQIECRGMGEAERTIPIDRLREALTYEPADGSLVWLRRPAEHFKIEAAAERWNARHAGKSAGVENDGGYLAFSFARVNLLAHRVAFALVTGGWPKGVIDHLNHSRADNRAVNLRDVSHAENMRNLSQSVSNTSGRTGVSWHKASGRWRAFISEDGKHKDLGTFAKFGEAVAEREKAEIRLGFHKNHGQPNTANETGC